MVGFSSCTPRARWGLALAALGHPCGTVHGPSCLFCPHMGSQGEQGHGDCPACGHGPGSGRQMLSQCVPICIRARRGWQGLRLWCLADSRLSPHPLLPTEHNALEKPPLPFHLPIPPVKVCFLYLFLSSFPPSLMSQSCSSLKTMSPALRFPTSPPPSPPPALGPLQRVPDRSGRHVA